ncbi:MAG: tetratricopeptide repeat protein [Phycisphaerales bacterium]
MRTRHVATGCIAGSSRRTLARTAAALCASLVALCAASTWASLPPRGEPAPPVRLKDLHGTEVNARALAPRSIVFVFGELDHPGTVQACAEVLDAMSDPHLEPDSVVPILVVAKKADPAALREQAAKGRFPALVLHDEARDVFGAYHVLVLPSVVVVNGKGDVVHSMPGFVPRFKEIVTESMLVAAGVDPPSKLEQVIDPNGVPAPTPEAARASRLAHLGGELAKHRLYDMAEARFAEALSVSPDSVEAKLGLGNLMLEQKRTKDAEALFRSVLASHADSIDAILGLAAAQLAEGGDALDAAETAVRGVIGQTVSNARAHYLLGRILEERANLAAAALEYRKAAELLMQR